MMVYCAAPNCKNKSENGIRMFRFPRDKKRRAQWVQNCRREKWQPTQNSKLCEHHFEESQFEQNRADGRKLLKWTAVPTLFNGPKPPKSGQYKRKPLKERELLFESSSEAVDEAGSSAMATGEEYYNAGGGEWVEKLDTGQLCRICANPNEYLIPIFEGEGLEHELALKIKKHLPIEVSETDTLPRQVCYQCASTVLAWHDLVICCVEADRKLQELQAEENQDNGTAEVFEPESYDSDVAEGTVENKEDISDGKEEIDKTAELLTKRTSHVAKEKKPKQKSLVDSSCLEKSTDFAQAVSQEEKASESAKPNEGTTQDSSERFRHLNQKTILSESRTEAMKDVSRQMQSGGLRSCTVRNITNARKKNGGRTLKGKQKSSHRVKDELQEMPIVTQNMECKQELKEEFETNDLWYRMVNDDSDLDLKAELEDKNSFQVQGYQCSLCGKVLALKENLKIHMRIHSGEKPFTCHVCGKQFRWAAGLARHLKEVHAGIKEHACDICGRMFAAKATRDGHRRTHTGERPYVCDSCGKAFKTQATLYVHIKIHSDLFPFSCTHCGKQFRRHQDLLNHVTTHTGEKPHVCDVCGKGFGVKNDMRRHRRIHSDEKPYVCAICGLRFAQKRYLKNHDKNHHKRENIDDV